MVFFISNDQQCDGSNLTQKHRLVRRHPLSTGVAYLLGCANGALRLDASKYLAGV